jgi:sugar transferase (PEP-CTERM system associated)
MLRIFRHYVPGSFLILFVVESCILLSAIPAGVELRLMLVNGDGQILDPGWLLPRSILYALVMLCCMTFMGMYWRHRKEGEIFYLLMKILFSLMLSITVLSIVFFAYPDIAVDRSYMLMTLPYTLVMLILVRLLHYRISDHDAARSRVLVIGTGKKAMMVEELRRKSDLYGIKLMGFVYVAGENSRVSAENIMHIDESLLSYVNNNAVEELVVAVDDRRRSFPVDEILECKMDGILVSEVSDFIERQVQKIRLNTLHPSSMIFSEGFTRAVMNSFGKRTFDIVASSFLLLLTLPIMALTALSIWLESGFRGSILYKQERVGMDGKLFNVVKFRSMREDAENDGVAQWAQKGDNRVTRNGNVIRLLRIDELPQLYNVLKGEMSFVGPRPERPEFVKKLAQVIPFYNLRHKVKPGITGWAQISYPYGASEQDSIEKLQYDLYYIKRYSLMFDAFILFQTVQAVLWQRGGR